MRTSKPVATITYNSVDFLEAKLAELMRQKKIQDYIFILHHKEEDEKKDHIHLYIEPNTRIDTMDLQKFLEEPDLLHPGKPLRPIKFVACRSLDDWILYNEHFPPYLVSKYESREYIYEKEEFHYADENAFEDAYLHAHKASEWARKNAILRQLADRNIEGVDLILNGSIPLNLASQVAAVQRMRDHLGTLDRNQRKTHSPKDD